MDWFWLALCAALFYALLTLITKHLLKEKSPMILGVLWNVFPGIVFLILAIGKPLPSEWWVWALAIFNGLIYVASNLFTFYAIKHNDITTYAPLGRFYLVFVLIGAMIFLGESITLTKISGVLLMIIGSIVLVSEGKLFSKIGDKGVKYIFVGCLLNAFSALVLKYTIQFFDLMVFSTIIYLLPGFVFLGICLKTNKEELKHTVTKGYISIIAVTAVMVIAFFFEGSAYQAPGGDVSLVKTVVSLSTLIAMFGGFTMFKEKKYITQRLVGAVLMLVSVALIAGVFG